MRIGVPKETKVHEYHAGLTPAGVRELAAAGHEGLVQQGLGTAIRWARSGHRLRLTLAAATRARLS